MNLFGTLRGTEIGVELPFAVVFEVTPALVESLRMRIDFADVFEFRPWQGQEAMLYFDVFFADDAAVVTVDEVVYVGDAASRRILDGQDAVTGLTSGKCTCLMSGRGWQWSLRETAKRFSMTRDWPGPKVIVGNN